MGADSGAVAESITACGPLPGQVHAGRRVNGEPLAGFARQLHNVDALL